MSKQNSSAKQRRGKIIAWLYKVERTFVEHLEKPLTWFAIVSTIAVQYAYLQITATATSTSAKFVPLYPPVIGFILYLIVVGAIRGLTDFSKNRGANFTIHLGNGIEQGLENRLKIKPKNETYKRPNQSDIETIFSLFEDAYTGTLWGTEPTKRRAIYESHLSEKDSTTGSNYFLCLLEGKEIIGYSHIVPVNAYHWQQYLAGRVTSNDIDIKMVATKAASGHNATFGLVIVSVVLPTTKWQPSAQMDRKEETGTRVTKMVACHLDFLCREYLKQIEIVPVAFQTMNKDTLKFFKPYQKNAQKVAKGGGSIISFEIENAHFT